MNPEQPSSSLTDEEIEAFLATRPPWRGKEREEEMEGEVNDVDLTEFLGDQYWSSSHESQQKLSLDKGSPISQQSGQISEDTAFTPSISMPSAFAAQFMPGTPEQSMLLQALAEQQEQKEILRQQQQQRESLQFSNVQSGSGSMYQILQSNHIPLSSQNSPSISSISSHFSNQHQPTSSQPVFTSSLPSYSFAQQTPSTPWQRQLSLQSSRNEGNLVNETMMQHRQSASIGSPQSEIFSSPEEHVRQLAYHTPSRASHSSLQSVQEHGIQSFPNHSALSSPSEGLMISRRSTISDQNSRTQAEPLQGFVRRGSAEIAALRQRRQVRRTYTGPSTRGSSIYSPTTSFIDSTGNLSLMNDGNDVTAFRDVGTTLQSPMIDASTSSTLSPSDYRQRISEMSPTSIPPSLSAELAALGLDVNKFYEGNQQRMEGNENSFEGEDGENDVSMQRTSSSSSATTTKVRSDLGDQSLFSQNTTLSSGLDDSVFSINDPNSSRWIHGRDTPPSTPPKNITIRPSSTTSDEQMNATKDSQMENAALQTDNSTNFLKPDVHRFIGSGMSGMESAQTWPRRLSSSSSSTGSGKINFSNNPEGKRIPSHSPIQHSLSSDNARMHARLSPQLRLVRTPSSSSSSISLQHTRESASAASTIAAASAASGSSGIRRSRPSSRIFTSLEAANLSVESLRSENFSTSRSSRLRGGSSGSTNLDSIGGNRGLERSKRWSTSFINNPPSFESHSGSTSSSRFRRMGSGTGRGSEPDQYEQVSAALETLRTFLRQRGGGGGEGKKQSAMASIRSVSSQLSNVTSATTATSSSTTMRSDDYSINQSPLIDGRISSSPQQNIEFNDPSQQRILRHPPPGPLPPRGSLQYGRGESMPTPIRSTSSHSISPVASFNISPNATMTSNPIQLERSNTISTSSFDSMSSQRQKRPQRRHQYSNSSTSIDKVAVLEGLADRIRRMRDDDQLMQDPQQ